MLSMEWGMETALEVREEEGREKGREERDMELLAFLDKGYTPEDIVKELVARASQKRVVID